MGISLSPHAGNGERHHPGEGGLHGQPAATEEELQPFVNRQSARAPGKAASSAALSPAQQFLRGSFDMAFDGVSAPAKSLQDISTLILDAAGREHDLLAKLHAVHPEADFDHISSGLQRLYHA